MDLAALIDRMERFPRVLDALVEELPSDMALARPGPATWSITEIVTHLADEEAEDFRVRLRSTLEDPARAWPPIDPEGVAVERAYRSRTYPRR